jgi:hypothetical protein
MSRFSCVLADEVEKGAGGGSEITDNFTVDRARENIRRVRKITSASGFLKCTLAFHVNESHRVK